MDYIVINAEKREVLGKKVKQLRLEGKLPAVIYGKELEESIPISLDLRETTKILREVTPSTVVVIKVDGEEFSTLVRDRQRFTLREEYMHLDFLAISLKEKVRTLVNIFLEGEAPAVKEGAILMTGADRIEIEALPMDLPESIVVDISSILAFGDGIYVRDLEMPKGVECLSDLDEMLVVATAPSVEAVEEEGEEEELDLDMEPEVIEKGKAEEDGESDS